MVIMVIKENGESQLICVLYRDCIDAVVRVWVIKFLWSLWLSLVIMKTSYCSILNILPPPILNQV